MSRPIFKLCLLGYLHKSMYTGFRRFGPDNTAQRPGATWNLTRYYNLRKSYYGHTLGFVINLAPS